MSNEGFTSIPGSWSWSYPTGDVPTSPPAVFLTLGEASALRQHGYEVRRTRRGVLSATYMGEPTTMMTPRGPVYSIEGESFSVWIEPDGVTVRRE